MRKVKPKILSNVLMEIAKEHNLIDEIYNSSKIIDHLLKELSKCKTNKNCVSKRNV